MNHGVKMQQREDAKGALIVHDYESNRQRNNLKDNEQCRLEEESLTKRNYC